MPLYGNAMFMKSPQLLLFALLLPACSLAGRFALLVGNSDGGSRYEPLRYVRNDIREMKSALTQYCGFDEQNIVTAVNRSPRDVDRLLAEFKPRLESSGEATLFLFYYTGHAEGEELMMGDRAYPLSDFRKRFAEVGARVRIAVFDACQSGSFTRTKGGTLAPPFLFREEPAVEGQVVLYSSSASENSQESDIYGNSVFTFHFVNALRGCGDVSGDGKVTLSEAYQYSFGQTVSSTAHSAGGVQHPGYRFDIRGEGNVVLADLTMRSSGLVLDSDIAGNITILDRNRDLVTELKKEGTGRALIALNPGFYSIVSNTGDAILKTNARVDREGVSVVKRSDFKRTKGFLARPKGVAAGGTRLGLKVSGGYRFLDLSALSGEIHNRVGDYKYFGMSPSVWLPDKRVTIGGEVEIVSKLGIVGFAGFDYLKYGSDRSFAGTRVNQVDGRVYGSSLTLTDTLKALTIRFGAGYSLPRTVLKNLSIRAGFDFVGVGFKAGSHLTDSLFDIETSSGQTQRGMIVLPHIGVGYSYRVWRMINVGVQARYRYQKSPQRLEEEGVDRYSATPGYVAEEGRGPLEYDMSGFDANAFLMVEFRFD